jgi:DNA-binding response OmpR family regulator
VSNILIIDDDLRTAEYVGRHLQAAGHTCSYGANGAGALSLARREHPDLIILDIMLPDVSGFEVCRQLRRDPALYAVPVVVLSAMNGEEEVRHGLAQGADDYVSKPFQLENLLQRVENLLSNVSAGGAKDVMTSLLSAEGLKRELQRKISQNESFSLAYVELVDLRRFGQLAGLEARDAAIRHLGLTLARCVEHSGDSGVVIGHMGSGHFACIFPQGQAGDHCNTLREAWLDQRERTYEAAGLAKGYRDAMTNPGVHRDFPLLDVQCCVTTREAHSMLAPKDLFDVISKLRSKALQSPHGGTYVDRRRPGK